MSQQIHRSDPRILNRRTLQRDHSYLPRVLRTGMAVLDVGCGTGAITADIAKAVGPGGMALGIDRDDANLAIAIQEYRGIGNLRFESADILTLDVANRFGSGFDIVTAARTIQWISEPERAIVQMRKAAKPEGHVIVLDYNLEETSWEPEPPVDFRRFYKAFLDWRAANNWDNRTASHLTEFFQSAGLVDIASHPTDEIVRRGDPEFFDAYASKIWLYVIETVGPNLVQAGFLEEGVRRRAEEDYSSYVQGALRLQKHSMSTVEGRVPS
jgi:ubiquinone/menaquinone biosynthesis C-methylase UbiE